MISIEEALARIARSTKVIGTEYVKVDKAYGRVLAADMKSLYDLPRFTQSAMDGYALCSKDTLSASKDKPVILGISGTVQATSYQIPPRLAKGKTVKIFTGAPLPRGADTVIIQENAVVKNGTLLIKRKLSPFDNVRKSGEEVRKNEILIKRGTRLNSGMLSVVASQGFEEVEVFKRPTIAVITTGNEIVKCGKKLSFGQIYDTNYTFLVSFLQSHGFEVTYSTNVSDRVFDVGKALNTALRKADVIITTGGVSVGEKDFVKEVAKECGFKDVFWRVSQKPGGPLYFAKQGRKYIFGLPGNPAATFVCFYLYVWYFLNKIENCCDCSTQFIYGFLKKPIIPHRSKTLLIRCDIKYDKAAKLLVIPLPRQASYMITNLVRTRALAIIAPSKNKIYHPQTVPIYLLPH